MLTMAMAALSDPKAVAADVAKRLGITTTTLYTYVNGDGCKDAEGQSSIGGGGVNLRPGAGQYLQADAPHAQVFGGVDQVSKIAPQAIQFPEDERVTGLKRLEAGDQARTRVIAHCSQVFIDALGVDARNKQCIALRSYRLGAIGLRYPGVTD